MEEALSVPLCGEAGKCVVQNPRVRSVGPYPGSLVLRGLGEDVDPMSRVLIVREYTEVASEFSSVNGKVHFSY